MELREGFIVLVRIMRGFVGIDMHDIYFFRLRRYGITLMVFT